jgi:Ser/Thr protein kinase RdoA (MazF antagonist)
MTEPLAGPLGEKLGERLGVGREAEVYAWGEDAVLKLYRPDFRYQVEALALERLDGRGVAPRLIDVVAEEGRTGLVLERLDGTDMLALLGRQPRRVWELARLLASTHHAVHAVRAPAELPDVREVLADRIARADLPEPLRDFTTRVLASLPAGDRLSHGDFHPGNVLVAADRVGVIDWSTAARGAPEADHARTLLLLRWADPVSQASVLSRALTTFGRSVFARAYARAYAPQPLPQLDSWLLVHAAARLAEGIEAERPALLKFLRRRSR